mgnify:FL=1
MKVFIIENEAIAVQQLKSLLIKTFPNVEIVGTSGYVSECVNWFSNPKNEVDIVLMDVELSDGNSFDILDKVDIHASIIITTVYDKYAIKAFEINSVDYLLKPVKEDALKRAISKSLKNYNGSDIETIVSALAQTNKDNNEIYKRRFIIHSNNQIYPIKYSNIAYIYSENKLNTLVTIDGRSYITEKSMNAIYDSLDKKNFFRVSRSCILSRNSIKDWYKMYGIRYSVILEPRPDSNFYVSLSRTDAFTKWLKEE